MSRSSADHGASTRYNEDAGSTYNQREYGDHAGSRYDQREYGDYQLKKIKNYSFLNVQILFAVFESAFAFWIILPFDISQFVNYFRTRYSQQYSQRREDEHQEGLS